MTTFFSILFVLIAINAVLLIFSVNGNKQKHKRTIIKISEKSIAKAFPHKHSETAYKKAV